MKIQFSLSGFNRRSGNPFSVYSMEFRQSLIGKAIYADRYKTVGRIIDIDPDADLIYAEIEDKEYSNKIIESVGYNCCSFEIVEDHPCCKKCYYFRPFEDSCEYGWCHRSGDTVNCESHCDCFMKDDY